MATMAESKIEPIKTALAMGNYAEARRLRTELWRDALKRVSKISDLEQGHPAVAIGALLADKLDIPEEP